MHSFTRNTKNKRTMYSNWENQEGLVEHLEISVPGTLLSSASSSYNLREGIACSWHRDSKGTNSYAFLFTLRHQKVNCSI